MGKKISTQEEFEMWVKLELVRRGQTQRSVAQELGLAPARICDAIKLKTYGKRYVPLLIEALGGNLKDFKKII